MTTWADGVAKTTGRALGSGDGVSVNRRGPVGLGNAGNTRAFSTAGVSGPLLSPQEIAASPARSTTAMRVSRRRIATFLQLANMPAERLGPEHAAHIPSGCKRPTDCQNHQDYSGESVLLQSLVWPVRHRPRARAAPVQGKAPGWCIRIGGKPRVARGGEVPDLNIEVSSPDLQTACPGI